MAIGKTGVAALCPKMIRVAFRTQTCDGTQEIPSEYAVDVRFADVYSQSGDGHDATLVVHDAAHAKYPANSQTPSNADALRALARKIAADIWDRRRDRRPRTFAGVVAPDMSGLVDQVEWQVDASSCWTRFAPEPMNGEPEEYMHADVSECEWDGPGFRAFVPAASFANGNLTLPIARLYIREDGKLALKSAGSQVIKICP